MRWPSRPPIAIVFGAYFLRGYFILIVVAAVGAYLFTPLFNRFNKRIGTGLSATLTLLAAIASVVVPLGVFVYLAVVQITTMVERVADWVGRTDLSALGDQALRFVNDVLHRIPFTRRDGDPRLAAGFDGHRRAEGRRVAAGPPARGRGRRVRRHNGRDPVPVRVHLALGELATAC